MWAINWAGFSYASWLVLWLSILVTVLYVTVMLALNAVEMLTMRFGSANSLETLLRWKMKNAKVKRLVNRWIPRVGMLFLGYVLGQAQMFSPIRELHNVSVLEKLGPRQFVVDIPAQSNPSLKIAHDTIQTWRLCAWGDDLPLKAGMVMTIVQYKQQSDCQLIDSQTEVKYLRDRNKNVVSASGQILFAKE